MYLYNTKQFIMVIVMPPLFLHPKPPPKHHIREPLHY